MPMYDFQCQEEACHHTFDRMVRLSEFDEVQPCPECGADSKRLISKVGVVLKGDGWASKNGRIAKQMAEKNQRLAAKEKDQKAAGLVPRLAPNVGGQRVDSWSDAKKLAKSKGKETSSYDKLIRREKAGVS